MKQTISLLFLVLAPATLYAQSIFSDYPTTCDPTEAAAEFKKKICTNPYPEFSENPYRHLSAEMEQVIHETNANKDIVCAIQYEDEDKTYYNLKTFETKADAEDSNYIVTHQGQCGACSNLHDLSIYLTKNLSAPLLLCALVPEMKNKIECVSKAWGVTYPCA